MTPWARKQRAKEETLLPNASSMDKLLAFALNVIAAVLITFLLLSLPVAKADTLVENFDIPAPRDPAEISKFRLGDVLIFESFPRSVSLALTSEEVDLSILFKLKAKLSNLSKYAKTLAGNNLIPLAQAPGYCRSHGYANSLTPVLSNSLKVPHYIEVHESRNSAEKVYLATLRESGGSRYCNFTLSYSTKFSLTSVLDLGSSYYTVNRNEKYNIFRTWLTDRRGEACQDGLTVHRGEISPEDTEYEWTIDHTDGSIFSCSVYCANLNGLREQALRSSACILGETCKPFAKSHCETYSYNWQFSRCRVSSKANPVRDLATHGGWNSLVAFRECRALTLHQTAKISINGSLHDISHVCRFSHKQQPATSTIYRSCPGISNGLSSDITPLETTLDRYILSLESADKKIEPKANNSLPLESIDTKTKRAAHLLAMPTILTALRPALSNFLTIGTSHLSNGVGLRFLGNALPLTNLLLLTTNLIALTVGLAVNLSPAIYHEPIAKLKKMGTQTFEDWSLVRSPDLYELQPLSNACKLDTDIRHNDAIPELLKEIGTSLKSLQVPISRLITDSAPLSAKVHEHISKEDSGVYGFWSTYDPSRKALVRYFTYEVRGGPETMTRQNAILSGSSVAPVSEGTLIQGGPRKPGSLGPNWGCIEYITNARNTTWVPDSCYGTPSTPKAVHSTAFLPNARIYRIFGKHRLDYSCPRSPVGTALSRGLLIMLVPNECLLAIDGSVMRDPDSSSKSAWLKPIRLVDKASEYQARKGGAYPKYEISKISRITNDTLIPAIVNINAAAGVSRSTQHLNDIGLALAISAVALAGTVAACYMYKKLHGEHFWLFIASRATTTRLNLPARWARRTPDPDAAEPGIALGEPSA